MADPAIRFGAAYYLECSPTPDLDRDLDLMAGAGFTVIPEIAAETATGVRRIPR